MVRHTGLTLIAVVCGLAARAPAADVDFQAGVMPILARKCFRCHAGDKPDGNLSLTDRAALLRGGDGGPAIVPEDAARSLLIPG
jgi:hypothetical protein